MKPLFVVSIGLTLALSSQAQQAPAGADRQFQQLDQNHDGKISREELPEALRPNFDRVDTNHDGGISPDEHLAVIGGARGAPGNKGNPPDLSGIEVLRDLPYAETENPRQRLDVYLPKARKSDAPLPIIVFIHGGAWQEGDKSSGQGNLLRYVKSGDYAGISIGYRLTNEAQWPAQIHDCKAAIRWIKSHAKERGLDPGKVAVWGISAGGHLVSMLGTSGDVKELEGTLGKHLDQDSKVTCVLNYFGPEDLLTFVRQPSTIDRTKGSDYPEAKLLGGPVQEHEAAAKEASPVTHVSKGDAPFFTAHGTKDPLVPYAQAKELHATLQKAGVPSLLQEMTNGGHGFQSAVLDERVKQFLDLHLRGIKSELQTTPINVAARP